MSAKRTDRQASNRRAQKRAFGEVDKLPSGRFRARYTGPDGKRHSSTVTFVSRIDAEGWLAGEERRVSRGDWETPSKSSSDDPQEVLGELLLASYARDALRRRRLRPTTLALYDKLLRLAILPTLGDRPLAEIDRHEVTEWYLSLAATPTQQANAYGLLKSLFKQAIEEELLTNNPCRVRGGTKKQPAKEIDILTVSQLNRYLDAVPAERRVPLLLAGWCVLRSGEVRGLRVRDLDLDHGLVHVRQAVVRLSGRMLVGPPKTAAGVRSVAIPPHLVPKLRLWLAAQPERPRDALLFPAGDGVSPLNDTVLWAAHAKGKKAIGMPGLTIHGLRHTSATMAAQLGATIAELQARIGHTTPDMALRYQHVAGERDAQIAARMSQLANAVDEEAT